MNGLTGDTVRLGQTLIIPGKASPGEYYSVRSGDSLSKISLLFDISQDQLRQINNLQSDSLSIGDKLYVAPAHPQIHKVETGDTLWDIARQYGIDQEKLSLYNNLAGSSIYPGQELKLYSRLIGDFEMGVEEPQVLTASYRENRPEPLEEYRNYEEDRDRQPSRNYSETRLEDPVTNYNQARQLLSELDQSISRERRLGNSLAGYTIVLDPGHGGLDPGAIVASKNGNGETVYVVEDEYAYDITLRTYRLLKLHGADVTLTVISPNHQIRNSNNPSETFVNMKNEVYNMRSMNSKNDNSSWPVGGSRGLRKRVEIAEEAFSGKDASKTLYISIHADNSPDHGQGSMVLYSEDGANSGARSKELTEALLPFLGASSTSGTMDLAVLRDNPAFAEVLIEIRNIHYPGNSWAIRYDKLRQQDAEFIARGIINYAENR